MGKPSLLATDIRREGIGRAASDPKPAASAR